MHRNLVINLQKTLAIQETYCLGQTVEDQFDWTFFIMSIGQLDRVKYFNSQACEYALKS